MSAFVSRDGADGNGVRAEVYVQAGTGKVTRVEYKDDPTKKNVQVHVESPHLQHAVKGWLQKSDPLFAEVVVAFESGQEVAYRVEAQRKTNVSRSEPIMPLRATTELARENTKSIFAGLDGTLSQEAVTNPREDQAGGRIPATDENTGRAAGAMFSVEQALAGLANARTAGLDASVVNAAAAFALIAGATPQQVVAAGVATQAAGEQRQQRRSHAVEAAPHVALNTDGRTNLGSYAVTAAFSAEKVARDILTALHVEAFEAHNEAVRAGTAEGELLDAPEPVALDTVVALAKVLLSLADRVQVGAYGGGRPNRMGNSHTRARALVYDTVKHLPVPFGSNEDEQKAWKDAVVTECVERFRALAQIAVEVEEIPAPAGQQAQAEGATVTEIAPARAAREAAGKPPVEGEEGFVAPEQSLIHRFGALAEAAGFEPKANNPVTIYLTDKFGVNVVRKVHGPALERLVAWFEVKGDEGVAKFRQQVEQVAAKAAA